MKKPLAGKRAFFAQGQRAAARHLYMQHVGLMFALRSMRWPTWAQEAYLAGWNSVVWHRKRPEFMAPPIQI